MADSFLIEFRNATLWRGTTRVFDGLDLALAQHERVAILGPNGSGKTTLLKTINREIYPVVKPDSWVRILGRDDWNVWDLRRHIGVVSPDLQQRYSATTTALEVVVSGFFSSIGVHGTLADRVDSGHRERARAALARLGIGGLAGTPLRSMSTGEQRRCLLARALVHEPATLILDEPTTGLDLRAGFAYLRTVQDLARAGHNIVFVTHHLNEIAPDVERVVILKAGGIAADGPPGAVLNDDTLSAVFETPIRVAQMDGYFLAYPGG